MSSNAPNPVPGPYAAEAAALCAIAADLSRITDTELPTMNIRVTLSAPQRDEEAVTAVVDAMGSALCDRTGTAEKLSTCWYYNVNGQRGPVHVWVYGHIRDPTERDRDAEIARLKAALRRAPSRVVRLTPHPQQT